MSETRPGSVAKWQVHRRLSLLALFGAAVCSSEVSAAQAELVMDLPALPVQIQAPAQAMVDLVCPGAVWLSQTGEPRIPWQVATILLPPDAQLESVAVRLDGVVEEEVPGRWDMPPVGPEATWSGGREVVVWPADKVIVDGKDMAVYGKAAFWPDFDARLLATGQLRKWRLAQVAVPLVRCDPVNRRLQRLKAGRMVVVCERPTSVKSLNGASQLPAEWADRIGEEAVSRLAINYEQQVAKYDTLTQIGGKAAPMFNGGVTPGCVIITTSAIQTASTKLANFVTHKQSQGFNVSVITESGFGGGTGDAAANNIRAWLQDHYVSDNIEYVLLIGNPKPTPTVPEQPFSIPMKNLYPRLTTEAVPSDIYYADLTGNWNKDGDAYYGEWAGDWGAGGIDRFWEVIVGRIPYYGTIADLDYIFQKIMDHQNQPISVVGWRRSAILPMRDPDDWTGAFWLGEQIKNDILSPASWTWNRVYQAGTPVTPPPETTPCTMTNVTNTWKNGAFGLMLWWTHGSATSAVDVMDTTYAAQLNDNHPSFTFQCSCNNAYPEVANNLCYTLLKKGAVCTIGDTRTSWYDQGQSSFNGSASNAGLAYEFASRLVADNMTAGHAIFDVTMVLTPSTDKKWMNFCDFAIYGDPGTYLLPRCGRRYVNASAAPGGDGTTWETAYKDLQAALDERSTEIWVAAGSYKPDRGTANRSASFRLEQKTAIYGGFTGGETDLNQRDPAVNVTILSGDLAGNDGPSFTNNSENTYNVVISRGCDSTSILDGLTIAGGNASNASSGVQDRGAGLYNYSCSSPAIRNCIFTSNRSKYDGGAMYNGPTGTSPTVANCGFSGNYAEGSGGAVSAGPGSRARFTNCTFTANSGNYGGAMSGSNDYSAFTGCTFIGNIGRNGGGAIHDSTGSPTLVNCRFLGNTANTKGGALYFQQGSPTVVNCLVSGNTAGSSGGAIQDDFGGTPKFINCTIVGNVCTSIYVSGGGLYVYGASPAVTNCIFWANRDKDGITETAQICRYSGTVTVNYSCVQNWSGSMGGTGNTGEDPQMPDADGPDDMVGTADDDPRLLATSPCLDTGDNNVVPADTLDVDSDGNTTEPVPLDPLGNPRFTDMPAPDGGSGTPPIVDVGVSEGGLQAFLLSPHSVGVPEGGTATFTVRLALDPGDTLQTTVARVSGDTDITVQSGESLTFDSSNYAVPQTVTLAAAEDADNLAGTALIQVAASGTSTASLTATEVDNEPIPDVLYVDADAPGINDGSSWAGAYAELRTAMELAAAHSNVHEIRVAQGTYKPAGPSGSRDSTLQLTNGLAIKGGYAGFGESNPDARSVSEYETILSGDLNGNDTPGFGNNGENSYHVVTSGGTDATAVLDGFTITAGNASGAATPSGAGLLNVGGSPTILDCTFKANNATNGAGLYGDQDGNPALTGCRFIANNAGTKGGGLYIMQAAATIARCQFLGNNADGDGGGIAFNTSDTPLVVNCIFSGNTCGNAGAGVYLSSTEATVVNCSFSANSAASGAGGLHDASWSVMAANCILWGNTSGGGGGQWAQVSGASAVDYCCIEGLDPEDPPPGTGNHENDPLFVDADGPDGILGTPDDNMRLSAGSPCVDAADNARVPAGVVADLDLGPRFVDDPDVDDTGIGTPPIVDMGAYEKRLPGPPTDYDGDSDVDGDDAELFEACASGPGIPLATGCENRDFDDDSDVDQVDFAVFQRCLSGDGVPADLDCVD